MGLFWAYSAAVSPYLGPKTRLNPRQEPPPASRCYLPTYLLTYLPTYLLTYLPTCRHDAVACKIGIVRVPCAMCFEFGAPRSIKLRHVFTYYKLLKLRRLRGGWPEMARRAERGRGSRASPKSVARTKSLVRTRSYISEAST